MKIVIICLFLLSLVLSFEIEVGYGVDPENSILYENDYFECDKNSHTKRINKSQINDNYCDCQDGTDEPGTSACNNMHFYCKNEGHIGEFISSTRVNDGICDCCDGSDEYNGLKSCENVCKSVHEQWEIDNKALFERETKGQLLLEEWSLKGMEKFQEKRVEYIKIKEELEGLRTQYNAYNTSYYLLIDEYNQQHALLEFKQNDLTELYEKAGIVNMNEEELRFIIINMLKKLEDNQNKTSAEEHDTPYDALYDSVKEIHHVEAVEDDHELLTSSDFQRFSQDYLHDPKILDMKTNMDQFNNDIIKKEAELETIKKYLQQEHGYYYELDSYIDQCYSERVGKYNYKICPFGSAYQDHTSLGSSFSFERNPKLRIIQDEHIFTLMQFSNGEKCWNGPLRSINVELICDFEISLQSITEPSTCVYNGILNTPTACKPTQKMIDMAEKLHKEQFQF